MLSSYPAMPYPHEHDYISRPMPELERDGSPSAKSVESGDPCQTPQYPYSPLPTPSGVYAMKSCLSIPILPLTPPCTSKSVTFSPHPPSIHEAPSNAEYDRTPHAVVPRLTYRDVLEMREVLQMTVELGIFSKRDRFGPSSSADSSLLPSPADSTASSSLPTVQATEGGPLGLDFPFPRPPRLSEFPNSKRLVKGLNDMPLCPPQPAQGMGMTVVNGGEGLDGVANWKPKPRKEPSPSVSPPSETQEEESEFAKEVREAREQLAELEVAKMRERERVDLERVKARTGAPCSSVPSFAATGIPAAVPETTSAGPSRKSSSDDLQGSKSALFFGTAWTGASSPALSSSSTSSFSNVESTCLRPPPSLAPQKRHLSPPISPRHSFSNYQNTSALHSPLPEREPSPHPAALGPTPRNSFFSSPVGSPPSPKRKTLPPTSPILAPFARSTPLTTVTERRGDPTPPSPILAPFARSAKLN